MMVAGAFATQTYAAGFQLSEQSAIQMGRAMAGAGVVGDDLSAVHYPKSRSKRSRYSSENDVLIEKSVKYTDFFLLSIVYV